MDDMIKFRSPEYCVDIVVCIDLTSDMHIFIEEFKEKAINFYESFIDAMEENGHEISQFRIRVIGFGDTVSGVKSIVDSGKFFLLPDEKKEFGCFVRSLPGIKLQYSFANIGLEAIEMAMKSDWTNAGDRQKHVILMLTSSAVYKNREKSGNPSCPEGMPVDLDELARWWKNGVPNGSFNPKSGRMAVFAPEAYPWSDMMSWNRCWIEPCRLGAGPFDVDYQLVIDVLPNVIFG